MAQPQERDAVPARPVEIDVADGIGLVRVERPDHHYPKLGKRGMQAGGGREHLAVALLPNQTPHQPTHDVIGSSPHLRPQLRGALRETSAGIEAGEIDSVAEQVELRAGHAEAREDLDVLRVLHELRMGAAGGQTFERVDDGAPRGPVLGGGVEAVHGVDDRRAPAPPAPPGVRRHPASGCGCGRCRAATRETVHAARRARARRGWERRPAWHGAGQRDGCHRPRVGSPTLPVPTCRSRHSPPPRTRAAAVRAAARGSCRSW